LAMISKKASLKIMLRMLLIFLVKEMAKQFRNFTLTGILL
jgi:hypothetical protein